MSAIDSFASLGLLQTALNQAISGISCESSAGVLADVQQLGVFQGLSDLNELTSQDNLARMAINPLLYNDVAQVLGLDPSLGRTIYQREIRADRLFPASPTRSPAPAAPLVRPAPSCAMDMVGADFSHASELPEVDLSSPLSPAEIARNIFTDIHNLQGKLRISPMEQRIRSYAGQLDLRQGVQIYRRTPSAMTKKIFELMNLAVQIAKIMDDDAQGYFRETMHENHSRQVILDYLQRARDEGPDHAVPLLERALRLYDEIYEGGVELGVLGNVISRALKDELAWPEQVTLDNLGAFAVSLRRTFDARGAELSVEQRYHLMRLAICLDAAAFGLCALNPDEVNTASQALKMAALIEVLYGCGFGDERWLVVSDRLREISQNWETMGPARAKEELCRYGVLAAHMLEVVKTSYHALFDPLIHEQGRSWGMDETEIRSFTRSLYRTSALFPLGQHLAALHVRNGNGNRVEQVLDRMLLARKLNPLYAATFLGEARDDELLDMGNKGKGLNELIRLGEPVRSGFALPPVLMANVDLNEAQLAPINSALDELERRTGKSFADGTLRVAVRSGAAVSMPGNLLTIRKLGTREEVLEAIRTVYRSWDTHDAQLYRRYNGIPDDFGTSVIVQEWLDTTGDDASGFGLATSHGQGSAPLVRYGRRAEGIDLVSGDHPGQDSMDAPVENELAERIRRYEDHFQYPVEVEFGVESGHLEPLQIRRAQLRYEDEVRWTVGMIRDGRMTREAGIAFLGGRERLIGALNAPRLNLQGNETRVASEAKGGGRPLIGAIALDETGIRAMQARGLEAIFVTGNADAGRSAAYAFEAGAVIFNEGNGVSHLEGDLRASNRPHLGGIPVLVDREARTATIGGMVLREGDVVTLDPPSGVIYHGEVPIQQGDSPVTGLIRWLVA